MRKEIVLVCLVVLLFSIIGCSSQEDEDLQRGILNISVPQNQSGTTIETAKVKIYADGEIVEEGVGEYDLKPKTYKVEVIAADYQSFEKEYTLKAGEEINIIPELQKKEADIYIVDISLEQTRATVEIGSEFNLPETGIAELSDGSTKEVDVLWQQEVDTSQKGEYTYTAIVANSDETVEFTLIVTEKSSLTLNLPEKIIQDEKITISGEATGEIEEVRITVGGQKLINPDTGRETWEVKNQEYGFNYTFTELQGQEEIVVQGLNEENKIISETRKNINIATADSFSLDYPEQIEVGEEISFTGGITGSITELRIKVDDYVLDTVEVVDKQYQLDYTFTHAGSDRELLVQALNEAGDVVASTKEKITVLEKPSVSLTHPAEVTVEEVVTFTGAVEGAIQKVRIKVDNYVLKTVEVVDKQYQLEYTFNQAGENRKVVVQGLNQSEEVVIEEQGEIDVLSTDSNLLQGETIVIDAGHGGRDSGAVGYSGYLEKKFNLAIAQRLKELLNQTSAEVIMTRDSDVFVELGARSTIANQAGADFFISIHANAAANEEAHGTEIYIDYEAGSATQQLAQKLQGAMLEALGTFDRGVKTRGFSVLRNTNCHAVLIEAGFLSNQNDEKILKNKEKQEQLAVELYQAIIENYRDYIPQGGYFYTNEF